MNEGQLQKIKQRYNIVGNNEGLNRAIDVALKIAPVDLSVLIQGENGVGKEVFPRIIHDHSTRKTKKYFAVNCGAIPEGTIDSELFGHEKGAFTGAIEKREGYFSVANGGTLFLDEVETGEYIPVGASEVRKTDVRIVAATNVNMERAIGEGKFREDLYYRLNSVSIAVPPLRERGEDVVLLFRKFALEMSEKYKMPPIRLTEEARNMIKAYSWPGNVRQLKNIAENMSVTAEAREITPEILSTYLPEELKHNQLAIVEKKKTERSFENEREILYQILFDLRRDVTELKKVVNENLLHGKVNGHQEAVPSESSDIMLYRKDEQPIKVAPSYFDDAEEVKDNETQQLLSLEDQEKLSIQKALERSGGHRKLAADQLGISERTLYRKIKDYGLES